MKQSLFIPGPLPGMNDYIGRDNRFQYQADKKKWAALIQAEVKKAGLKPMERVHITWIWREPTKRRDPDNFISLGKKFCQDALVACRVLPNDGWANIVGYRDTWEISKEPGVLVILDDNV